MTVSSWASVVSSMEGSGQFKKGARVPESSARRDFPLQLQVAYSPGFRLGRQGRRFAVASAAYLKRSVPMARATARHILVSTEAKCNELKAAIEGGADFAQVAKENSSCPSSRDGGNLGSFGPGQMVREFDTVVFSAPLNEVQGPVKTQFGYHLLEVTSRED
ncbi:peptidylprolyl isomerase [Stutzerimonas stutzeri]